MSHHILLEIRHQVPLEVPRLPTRDGRWHGVVPDLNRDDN